MDIRPILVPVALVVAIATGVWLVRYAKRGSPGAHALGAVFLLFGMGNFRDPTNSTVQESNRRGEKDDDSGEPLDKRRS